MVEFGLFGSSDSDGVDLDVIRVTIPTVIVVDRQNISLNIFQDRDESIDRLIMVGLPELRRIVVGRFPHHPGILIVEETRRFSTEGLSRYGEFLHPSFP